MSEIEVPLESTQEALLEKAHQEEESWFNWVALCSALLAVLAAIAALQAGHNANEALLEQIHASDHWSYYQAKSIKSAVLGSKLQLLHELGKPISKDDEEKIARYTEEQTEISNQAKEMEQGSKDHLGKHQIFAKSVTLMQIAIAISAIAVLIRRQKFWFISLAFGVAGFAFLVQGFFF